MLATVNTRYSSPESALLLKDLFNHRYGKVDAVTEAEIVFGASLARECYNIDIYTSTNDFLLEYHSFDMKKIFGLSIIDYFDLTLKEKTVLILRAIKYMETSNKIADEIASEYGQGLV